MSTYYHGTPIDHERGIDRQGILPRATCRSKTAFDCDPHAIYVTKDASNAVGMARDQDIFLDPKEVIVYRIRRLPRGCKIIDDPGDFLSFKIVGCNRVHPQQKCRVNLKEFDDLGGTYNCKWVKV